MKVSRASDAKVDPRNVKSKEYKKVMEEIVTKGVCPFCPENFKWHTKPILNRDGLWLITKSFQPYQNTKHHLLMIGKKHKETFSELSPQDLKSLMNLTNWAIKKFGIRGGGLVMRFGDTLFTGATVKHLHVHIIVPLVKKDQAAPVYFPIG